MQLLILSITCLVGGLILTVAMSEFNKPSYGLQQSSNPFVPISAACASPVNVTATSGCDHGDAECIGQYRENCELPFMAGAADLAMSVFVLAAIVASKFFENEIVEELDEAVQTAQDYSVVVNDPDADADSPDEWFEFFSRFGKVRYVTITRKNSTLTALIAQKHHALKKLHDISMQGLEAQQGKRKEKYERRLQGLDIQLEAAYTRTYPTCRVYITFEKEEHQRLCLEELEVPDIAAILDLQTVQPRKMFRGVNVLDVCEPPEPDSVLWENVELDRKMKMYYEIFANLASIGLLVLCYFIVDYSQSVSSLFLSFVIAAADTILPMFFEALTDISCPHSEGKRQSNLQVRLFLARLLLSTVFPYLQTAWNGVLDADFISQVVSVQIAACFVTPIVSLFDIGGIVTRNIIAPLSSDSQGELNSFWMGSSWSLAERYTGISKILFVSLYYTLLNPISLIIAMVAFLLVFLIDRFLLLRRWKMSSMLDAMIARRLRQQGILAVALHMAVTVRFIYSWPMDSVMLQADGSFAKVDKFPPIQIWLLSSKHWMGDSQASILRMYRITTLLVCIVAIYIWIIDPIFRSLHKLFCYDVESVGDVQDVPFSAIAKTPCYVPTTVFRNEQFLCSYIKDMLPHNKPSMLRASPGEEDDLSGYVPEQYQPHVLSVVKYYGDPADDGHTAELGMGFRGSEEAKRDEAEISAAVASHARYVTNADGVLAPVQTEIPIELLDLIRPKSQTVADAEPLSPEERKKRRIKRNFKNTSRSGHIFPSQSLGRIEPLPAIGLGSEEGASNDRPLRAISTTGRSNRPALRPIMHSSQPYP